MEPASKQPPKQQQNNHQVPSQQHNLNGAFHITNKSLDFVSGHKAPDSKKCQSHKKLFSFKIK